MRFKRSLAILLTVLTCVTSLPVGNLPVYASQTDVSDDVFAEEGIEDSEDDTLTEDEYSDETETVSDESAGSEDIDENTDESDEETEIGTISEDKTNDSTPSAGDIVLSNENGNLSHLKGLYARPTYGYDDPAGFYEPENDKREVLFSEGDIADGAIAAFPGTYAILEMYDVITDEGYTIELEGALESWDGNGILIRSYSGDMRSGWWNMGAGDYYVTLKVIPAELTDLSNYQTEYEILTGSELELKVYALSQKAVIKDMVWTSSSNEIVSIVNGSKKTEYDTSSVTIKAGSKTGVATVKASLNGIEKTFTITVKEPSSTWNIDENGKLTVVGKDIDRVDYNGKRVVPWYSERANIVTAKMALSEPTDLNGLFDECSNLESADLSELNTAKVTNMNAMFRGCAKLSAIDVTGFDTSCVEDMRFMFSGCYALTSIDVSGFDTSKVTDMGAMFGDCKALASLDVSKFDTANVTNMGYMFGNCAKITKLDLKKFDTTKVTNMNGMFNSCEALKEVDVSSFDTSIVYDMSFMFANCFALEQIDVTGFDTSRIQEMNCMFLNCGKLETLDLSSFALANVTIGENFDLLSKCNSLVLIKAPKNINGNVILPNSGWIRQDTNASVTSMPQGLSNSVTLYKANADDIASGVDHDILWRIDSTGKLYIKGKGNFDGDWRDYSQKITSAEVELTDCTDLSDMFNSCSNLTSVKLEKLDSSKVTGMKNMFCGCSSLENIDLSKLDTSNVTDMSYMFKGCSAIESISLDFDAPKLENAAHLFENCTSLKNAGISFNNSPIKSAMGIFQNCNKLESVDFSNLDFSVLDSASDAFKGCSSLTTIKAPRNVNKLIPLPGIAWIREDDQTAVTSIPMGLNNSVTLNRFLPEADDIASGIKNNIVWRIDKNGKLYIKGKGDYKEDEYDWGTPWMDYSDEIISAEVELTDCTDLSHMFYDLYNLKSVNLDKLDTSKVTSMNAMFGICSSLENIDLSKLDTSNVRYFGSMFSNCSSLESIDLSGFDTSNAEQLNDMFRSCKGLTQIDISSFDTSKATVMPYMFSYCSSLKSITFGDKFSLENTTDIVGMFYGCSALESISFEYDAPKLLGAWSLFKNCTSLKNVSISLRNSQIKNAKMLFMGCKDLESVDLSNINLSKAENVSDMFKGCDALTSVKAPIGCPLDIDLPIKNWKIVETGEHVRDIPKGTQAGTLISRYTIPVESIEFDKEEYDVTIGGQVEFSAEIKPARADKDNITITSTDDRILSVSANMATVSQNQVTGLFMAGEKQGKVTVTAQDGEVKSSVIVNVNGPIRLDKHELTLISPMEMTSTLVANITNVNGSAYTSDDLVWSSSDENILTVDKGVITAKYGLAQDASATITVKTSDGKYSDTCTVTVKQSTDAADYVSNLKMDYDDVNNPTKVLVTFDFSDPSKIYSLNMYRKEDGIDGPLSIIRQIVSTDYQNNPNVGHENGKYVLDFTSYMTYKGEYFVKIKVNDTTDDIYEFDKGIVTESSNRLSYTPPQIKISELVDLEWNSDTNILSWKIADDETKQYLGDIQIAIKPNGDEEGWTYRSCGTAESFDFVKAGVVDAVSHPYAKFKIRLKSKNLIRCSGNEYEYSGNNTTKIQINNDGTISCDYVTKQPFYLTGMIQWTLYRRNEDGTGKALQTWKFSSKNSLIETGRSTAYAKGTQIYFDKSGTYYCTYRLVSDDGSIDELYTSDDFVYVKPDKALSKPDNLRFDTTEENKVKVVWDKVDGAYGYQYTLKKNGESLYRFLPTTFEYVYLTEFINGPGRYTIEVCSLSKDITVETFSEVVTAEYLIAKVNSITVTSNAGTDLLVNDTAQLSAQVDADEGADTSVTWSSGNDKVVTVDENGLVKAVGKGTAKVTATANDGSGVSGSIEFTVSAIDPTGIKLKPVTSTVMVPGASQQFDVIITPADASFKTVTWTSSDDKIATVDESGVVKIKEEKDLDFNGKNELSVTITATTVNDLRASVGLTVKKAEHQVEKVEIDSRAYSDTLSLGDTFRLTAIISPANATDKSVSWTSSNTQVATIDGLGMVTITGFGSTTITALAGNGKSAQYVLKIGKINVTGVRLLSTGGDNYLATGSNVQLTAVVAPSNASVKELIWSSSDDKIAKVDENGIVTGIAQGKVRITVRSKEDNSKSSAVDLTVFDDNDTLYVRFVDGSEYTYSGKAITPRVEVYNRGRLLMEGTDYLVKYSSNIKANDAGNSKTAPKVTVTGKTVASSAEATFRILPKDIGDDSVFAPEITVAKGKTAKPILYYGGTKLSNKDFINPFAKDKFTASRAITVTGTGNFTGHKEIWVNVLEANEIRQIAKITVKTFKPVMRIYNGEPQYLNDKDEILVVSSTDKTKVLKENVDYYIAYPDDVTSAGTVKISIVGMGDYTGSVSKTYKIDPAVNDNSISAIDVDLVDEDETISNYPAYEYRPGGVLPRVEITVKRKNGKVEELCAGRDYKVTYKNQSKISDLSNPNKKVLSTASITFIGNYKSLKKIDKAYYIKKVDLSGAVTYATDKVVTSEQPNYPLSVPFVVLGGVEVNKKEYDVFYSVNGESITKKDKLYKKLEKAGDSITVDVQVKAKNKSNYVGTATACSYFITRADAGKDLSKATVIIRKKGDAKKQKVTKLAYTGNEIVIGNGAYEGYELYVFTGNIKNPTAVLTEGKDFYVEYSNNVNAGKATIIINGYGDNYFGSKTVNFTIVKGSMCWAKN